MRTDALRPARELRHRGDHIKPYPIDIKNIGEDVYMLMSKGHHDPHEFMRAVREDGYDWPLGMPRHTYARTVPVRTGEYVCRYAFTDEPGRGTYPVTWVTEAWGPDSYESIAASREAARTQAAETVADVAAFVTIRERIEELISIHGTLRAVARALKLDVGYLSRLERSERVNPSDDTLAALGLSSTVVSHYARLREAPDCRTQAGASVGSHNAPTESPKPDSGVSHTARQDDK